MKIERKKSELEQIFKEQIYFLKESSHEYDKGIEIESVRLAGHLRTLLHDSVSKSNYDSNLLNRILELKKVLLEDKKVNSKVNGLLQGIQSVIENNKKEQITSKSLMTLMGIKDNVKFIDTAIKDKNGMSFFQFDNCRNMNINFRLMPYAGLLSKRISGFGVEKKPKLFFQPLFFQSNFNIDLCPELDFNTWWSNEIYDNRNGIVLSRKDIILNVANQEGFAHVGEYLDYKYVEYKQKNILSLNINGEIEEFDNIPIYPTIRQIVFELKLSLKKSNYWV